MQRFDGRMAGVRGAASAIARALADRFAAEAAPRSARRASRMASGSGPGTGPDRRQTAPPRLVVGARLAQIAGSIELRLGDSRLAAGSELWDCPDMRGGTAT
jgi:hypothetical protein